MPRAEKLIQPRCAAQATSVGAVMDRNSATCAPQKVQPGVTRQFSATNIHDAIRAEYVLCSYPTIRRQSIRVKHNEPEVASPR
jgi:hypothetical protein